MRKVVHVFGFFLLVSLAPWQGLFAEENCYQSILKQQQKNYLSCLDSVSKNEKMRVSQRKLQIDLLERLVRVSSETQEKKTLCQDEMIQFFSQYGIKNLLNPIKDMGPELLDFWKVFLVECPVLKEKSQSE